MATVVQQNMIYDDETKKEEIIENATLEITAVNVTVENTSPTDVKPYAAERMVKPENSMKKRRRNRARKLVNRLPSWLRRFGACLTRNSVARAEFNRAKHLIVNAQQRLVTSLLAEIKAREELQHNCERELRLLREEYVAATGDIRDEFNRSLYVLQKQVKELQGELRHLAAANEVISSSLGARLSKLENGLNSNCFLKLCMADNALPDAVPGLESRHLQQARHVLASIRQ